ncbi:MAG TPA: adenylate/guanylate cyclase domain-containing protein, partial [Candidatus Ozemobacteraceae bacterium]|nr:adenylate/guanylate cyclase domain-containing protein [Candidatus Ozemobacteraceae bacterium]
MNLPATFRDIQLSGASPTRLLNQLWDDLAKQGIPVQSLLVFGHGDFQPSRHDPGIPPEVCRTIEQFLRAPADQILQEDSPALAARFPAKKSDSHIQIGKIVNADGRELALRNRQAGEIGAAGKRLFKFHEFLRIAGETWFMYVVTWEQGPAFARHMRTILPQIASRHGIDIEISRQTPDGVKCIARSGPPLQAGSPGTRTIGDWRVTFEASRSNPEFRYTARASLLPLRRRLDAEWHRALTSVTGNLLLVFLSGGLIAAWLTSPLRRMAVRLQAVAHGHLDQKLCIERRDEIGQAAATLDSMIDWLRERQAMSLFVAPQVLEAISGQADSHETAKRRRLVALVSDIRNFTTISESQPPEDVFRALNRHFRAMTPSIKKHGGVIDRFIGDAVQAVFYDEPGSPDSAERALDAAQEMMSAHRALQNDRAAAGLFTYEIGIGLATGTAVCGVMGDPHTRLDFSVIGDPIKEAAALEAASKSGCATRIVCDPETAAANDGLSGFLPVAGHPGALELAFSSAAASDINANVGAGENSAVTSPETAHILPGSVSTPASGFGPRSFRFASFCLLVLAAGLLVQFDGLLSGGRHERLTAGEAAELQHDLRLAGAAGDATFQVSIHLRNALLTVNADETGMTGNPDSRCLLFAKRLREMRNLYPDMGWSVTRHNPSLGSAPSATPFADSTLIDSSGFPFAGFYAETTALFSLVKTYLVLGGLAPDDERNIGSITARLLGMTSARAGSIWFAAYGICTQCSVRGVNGFLFWMPIVSPT